MSQMIETRTTWSQSLLEILQRQHAMVDDLVALANSQAALIAEGRTDRLLDLLAKRQLIIDEFTASQSRLGEMTRGLEDRLRDVAAGDRDLIRSLINGIGERLAQVMQRDERDQASLRSGREQIKRELSSMSFSRQARGAYSTVRNPETRFADHHG
jgi:hypothetical protein